MHPVLFHLPGEVPVYAYGALLGLSFVIGWHLTLGLCAGDGLDRARMRWCFLWTAASALLGSRLLDVIANPGAYRNAMEVLDLRQGGIVAYGGFLGGFLGAAAFCRWRQIRLLTWADCAAPSLCSGLIFTRLGCLMYGCDFGRPWTGPWAIRFPPGSPAFVEQRLAGLIGPGVPASLPVHPTQVYESLVGLVLLGLVLLVRRRRRPGEALLAFALGYGALRFLLEGLRADSGRGSVGALSTSQFVALLTTSGAAVLALVLRARAQRALAPLRHR